jgi:hypothetical protein
MLNFRLKDVPWWFFIKSQNSYLIMFLYRRKTYFTAICTLLKNSRHFRTKYFLPVQIRALARYHICASFIHDGLILLTQEQDTNAEHLLIENSTYCPFILSVIIEISYRIYYYFWRFLKVSW